MFKALLPFITTIIVCSPMDASAADEAPQLKTSHFSIFAHGNAKLPEIQELADVLEHDFARISSAFNTIPVENIHVHLYADQWRYAMTTGNFNASGSIEGTSKLHFVLQAPGKPDNKKVAVHEFVHAVVLKLLIDSAPQPFDAKIFDQNFKKFPVWLWEALAVYEAGEFVDPKKLHYLKNGVHPKLDELGNRSKGAKTYEVGYTIIEYILQQYGKDKLMKLIVDYGDLQSTLSVTDEEFAAAWYRFVQEKYLKPPRE